MVLAPVDSEATEKTQQAVNDENDSMIDLEDEPMTTSPSTFPHLLF